MAPVGRVDVHVHLGPYWPELSANSYGPSVDFTPEGLLRELDSEGVTHALLLQTCDTPTAEEVVRLASEAYRASGGRLLPAVTVDPTRGDREVASAVARWEATERIAAVKLYPGYQPFYPSDARLDPVYAFAARRRIPIFIHQGDTLDKMGRVRFSRPIEVDDVAVAHRDVEFVLCHLGNPWVEETAELVYKNPNVWTDTSGLLGPPTLPYFPAMLDRMKRRLAQLLATIGDPSRVLYGSDWPLESIVTAVKLVDELDIPRADRNRILGENAHRLFGPGAFGRS